MQIFKTKEDIQNALNVSMATVNNWIKTGVIPECETSNQYSIEDFQKIIDRITAVDSGRLKGRANRSMTNESPVCFLGITDTVSRLNLSKAINIHQKNDLSTEESIFGLSIIQLKTARLVSDDWLLKQKTSIENFLFSWAVDSRICIDRVLNLYSDIEILNMNDDFIGAFYQSIQSISQKSLTGSYYTPGNLLEDIIIPVDKTVLDPCCGSGGILMKILDKKHNPDKVYARDIDELSLKICRINLCVFFNNPDIKPDIKNRNILLDEDLYNWFSQSGESFDYIVTNPPWGSKLLKKEKDILIKKNSILNTAESFSIALYNSMNKLSEDGTLIYFLPHSFLNVSTHKNIRKYILDLKPKFSITLLGNAFPGVMSESIRIKLQKNQKNEHVEIYSKDHILQSQIEYQTISKPDYIITATADNNDLDIINKVFEVKHFLLKGNAVFAIGIVTGNNCKYILSESTQNSEPVFRGKDIAPFHYLTEACFIEFNPELYQQTAKTEYYRQNKIAYRFISDKIVCTLDKENRLLLNSANLFIPLIGYPLETIVALFNSKLYTYLYRKMYHSKKVLRFHIESFPLPVLSEEIHKNFKKLHDEYAGGKENYSELNNLVYSVFSLRHDEIQVIEREA